MSKAKNGSGECLGVAFHIDERWKFVAPALEIEQDSFADLREAIERKQKARIATERVKLCIAATWTEEGTVVDGVITGINAGHGKLIAKPPLGSYKNSVYPRVGWIKMALAEIMGLRQREKHIAQAIEKYEVQGYKGYGFKPEMHAEDVERVSREMEENRVAAEATNLEEHIV